MSRNTRKKNAGQGFSLVELLVVISIVTVLLSLLLPSLGAAREAGRKAVCAGNQRQSMLGVLMWVADDKYRLPSWSNPPKTEELDALGNVFIVGSPYRGAESYGYWQHYLALKYMNGSSKSFQCPTSQVPVDPLNIWGPGFRYHINFPYYMDHASAPAGPSYGRGLWSAYPGKQMRAESVVEPSHKVGLMDTFDFATATSLELSAGGWVSGPYLEVWYMEAFPMNRHAGGVNITLLDGHGEYQKQSRITGTIAGDWTDPVKRYWHDALTPGIEPAY